MTDSKSSSSEIQEATLDREAILEVVEEAFLVRDAVHSTSLEAETVLTQFNETMVLADALAGKIDERVVEQLEATSEAAQIAQDAFLRFTPSRVSDVVRDDITYLKPDDNLVEAQATIMKADIEAVKKITTKKGLCFQLSDKALKELGLRVSNDGKVIGELDMVKVSNEIAKRSQGTEIFTDQSLLEKCRHVTRARNIIDRITGADDEADNSIEQASANNTDRIENGDERDIDAEDVIKGYVTTQMAHATPAESNVRFDVQPRADLDTIAATTHQFRLNGGPADVTAYHDFYDLQIAFRHIWTEKFDEELAKQGQMLYEEFVKLKKFDKEDKEPEVDTVNSVDELRKLKDDLRRAQLQIAGADPRFQTVKTELVPTLTLAHWATLDETTKFSLHSLAIELEGLRGQISKSENVFEIPVRFNTFLKHYQEYAKKAKDMLEAAELAKRKKTRVGDFLEDLEQRLSEKYAFDVFAANSINFGILVNYRQEWRPLSYQVGELVSTIPLAPKEVRRYTSKRVVKKSRAVQEIENSLQIRKSEASDIAREHAEIIKRADNKTNFKHNAEGSVNFVIGSAKADYSLEIDAARHSAQTKKDFREAVKKAAEEYKQDNKLSISTTSSEEFEETTSGEISNPNDELPVTYLFYELQRQYEISEKIQKLTPVILIANDVPAPHEIDEDWLLAHDWILRRVILDDSFLTALDYLSDTFVGDEISIEVLRNNVETHTRIVDKVSQQVAVSARALTEAQTALDEALDAYAKSFTDSGGLLSDVTDFLFGDGEESSETLRVRKETAEAAFARAERQQQELKAQLRRDVTALQVAVDNYTGALREQFNRRTEILRLRAHVKDNILYYMQAIWDQEPPDQRFFRLYEKIDVPVINVTPGMVGTVYTLPAYALGEVQQNSQQEFKSIGTKMKFPDEINIEYKTLVEVADLDNPLGYKGNYMIFPLKENNLITLFMMQDYLDIAEQVHLRDPDELGSYSAEELIGLARCYYKQNPEAFTDEVKEKLRDMLIKRLHHPYLDKEIITVPSDSLYIEALPGSHPILEDFKLVHRAIDVKKVQAEVRHAELENIRLAARVLGGEYEDPDIEKKIVIARDNEGRVLPIDPE